MIKKYLDRFPELEEFLNDIEERLLRSQLPPERVILDDFDVMKMLKISKRKLADLRANRQIRFHPTGMNVSMSKKSTNKQIVDLKGKRAGKIYYTLNGVLDYVQSTTIDPISKKSRL